MDQVTQMYLQARQRFDTLTAMQEKANAAKAALGSLVALGQNVTKDDVFKETMGLIQGGHATSREAASDLATMPPASPALADWVGKKAQNMDQMSGQLAQATEQARSQLAQAALHHLTMGMVGALPGMGQTMGQGTEQTAPALGGPNAG